MSAHHLSMFLAALAALPSTNANGQQPKVDRPVPKVTEPLANPISLLDLARSDVVLDAGAAEGAGAAERTGSPSPEGPTGKVVDLVVATQDGQLACAALAVGKILGGDEKVVLVPTTAFKTTMLDRRPAIALRLTKAELSALPDFDIKKEGKDGLERAVERARGLGAGGGSSGIRAEGDRAAKTKPGEASAASTEAPAYVLALSLPECTVSGTDTEFGNVHDAAVDPARCAVGYFIVARSGGAGSGPVMNAVPFRACKWMSHAGKLDLKIAKTSEQLKSAPEYKKPDQGILTPEQMKSADAFFASGKSGDSEVPRPL